MKKLLMLVAMVALLHVSKAQWVDSLGCKYDHAVYGSQLIAPAVLVGSGVTLGFAANLHQDIDLPIRDWVQSDGHSRFEIENYIQFAPVVTVLALNACGIKGEHAWRDVLSLGVGTYLIGTAIVQGLKYGIGQERPYGGVFTSFPSGHTADAFMGAEILRREYGKEYPGIAVAGYAAATATGLMRIYNNRHWASDVLAGAGIGILSASITYWLAPYLTF